MRRSETEIDRKNKSCGEEEVARRSGSVEVLDNEEFNRKIQKFIEDMKQTQKEEKRQEEEDERRRRRTEGNYVRMASLTSAVIH
ncbi:hypothetical protein C1H46_032487 [Malus baccata]|nr:hypothetical protein C1H46_032487 [Malus baccata]